MNPVFQQGVVATLAWYPEKGWGYYPAVDGIEYDDAYFQHYADLDGTDIADRLNTARVDLVHKYTDKEVLDIGIGSGAFIARRNKKLNGVFTKGYDVNPTGIEWLKSQNIFVDPYEQEDCSIDAVTLWDVLEHIDDPAPLLRKVRNFIFVSMPIYKDLDDLLQSKHYKPGEHIYYFTRAGLARWMEAHGFKLLERSDVEVRCGREAIESFAFVRALTTTA